MVYLTVGTEIRHVYWLKCHSWLGFLRRARPDSKTIAIALHHRLNPSLLARFGGEQKGQGQRHIDPGKGRVRAFHRARPQPGNDGELVVRL